MKEKKPKEVFESVFSTHLWIASIIMFQSNLDKISLEKVLVERSG